MNKEQVKKKLVLLLNEGRDIYCASLVEYNKDYYKNADKRSQEIVKEAVEKIKDPKQAYYTWYATSCEVVHFLSPRRLEEFERFYDGNKTIKKNGDLNVLTAGITHYFQGLMTKKNHETTDFFTTFTSGFLAQRNILKAIAENVDNVLFNLESEIQYGFSKSEIEVAKELQKNKHLREAGVIAGLVIEIHLKNVAKSRNIKLPKNPQMKHYKEALKETFPDATIAKQIELCITIRNKCAHASDNPPTDDQINTIISSAEIIIARVN